MTDTQHPPEEFQFGKTLSTVGVELEGYWDSNGAPAIKDDGSVSLEDSYEYYDEDDQLTVLAGEYAPADAYFNNYGELAGWIRRYWPDAEYGDESSGVDYKCGMHIHIGCSVDQLVHAYSPVLWRSLSKSLRLACTTPFSDTRYGRTVAYGGVETQTADWLKHRLDHGCSETYAFRGCPVHTAALDDWRNDRFFRVNYASWHLDRPTVEVRVLPMAVGGPAEALHLLRSVLTTVDRFWSRQPAQGKIIATGTAQEPVAYTGRIERLQKA
jgi:hypothetical protein